MCNLSFNPLSKDYFKAKACVAISRRYTYAGSRRIYSFPYLSFKTWTSSYRAAFCYVLKYLENASFGYKSKMLVYSEICDLFVLDGSLHDVFCLLEKNLKPFGFYFYAYSPVQKLSFVYILLNVLIKYNLGDVRYDLVSPMFEEKSAIRYAASKYFPDTSFIEIESDFMFKDVMD